MPGTSERCWKQKVKRIAEIKKAEESRYNKQFTTMFTDKEIFSEHIQNVFDDI